MSIQENKALVERYSNIVSDFFKGGSLDALDEIVAPDFKNHGPGLPPDRESIKQALPGFRTALSNFNLTTERMVAEGDFVVEYVSWTATHSGDMMGIPPSGKTITVNEMHMYHIKGGKIVERWTQWDMMGMMQQIGAMG